MVDHHNKTIFHRNNKNDNSQINYDTVKQVLQNTCFYSGPKEPLQASTNANVEAKFINYHTF